MNVFSYGRVDQLPSEEEEDEINLLIPIKFQHMGGQVGHSTFLLGTDLKISKARMFFYSNFISYHLCKAV